jgi:hypothetical protein
MRLLKIRTLKDCINTSHHFDILRDQTREREKGRGHSWNQRERERAHLLLWCVRAVEVKGKRSRKKRGGVIHGTRERESSPPVVVREGSGGQGLDHEESVNTRIRGEGSASGVA